MQIDEILNKMTSDLGVWKTISENYHIDLFCGLFMDGSNILERTNDGFCLSSNSIKSLGDRGICLSIDIHG